MGLNSISTTLNILREKKRWGGGLQMWKNSFCLLWPSLFWDECLIFFGGGGLYYSISHNSSFWKTRNRQRWLQQDPPCLDCHLLLFFGLENDFIYIQNMDQWDTSTLDFSFGWTGASFSPFTDWFQHIWFEVKGMKKRRMNRQDRYIDRHPDRMDSLVKEHLCHTTSHTVEVDG